MKKIIIISTSYAHFDSGEAAAGSFVTDFANALSQYAHVSVVAPATVSSRYQHGNLTAHCFAVPTLPLSLLKPSNPLHWFAILKTLFVGQRAINQMLHSQHADHILALWSLPSGYWAQNASKRYSIPYSTWSLGSDIWSLGQIPFVKNILATVLHNGTHCFADGYQLAQTVEEIGLCRCTFLPSARTLPIVPLRSLASSAPYRLAFLGRWHHNKGIDLLLEALHRLDDDDWKHIDAVSICGGGPLAIKVEQQVQALQAKNRPVTSSGYLSKKESASLLQWCDYLLIPSRIESIPVVFSDAVQSGRPIIATPVGDLPQLLAEKQMGILAKTINSDALRDAIRTALNCNPNTLLTRDKIMKTLFDINHIAKKTAEILT